MKLPDEVIDGSLRIGIGKFTTDEEIEQAARLLAETYDQIQHLISSRI